MNISLIKSKTYNNLEKATILKNKIIDKISIIEQTQTTTNVLNEDNKEYTSITVIFYQMADGEIQTITKIPC